MKVGWEVKPLVQCLDQFNVPAKIQRKQFSDVGTFPIVSQEADFINGYWDDAADVCTLDRPVVIFGDHTQVLKYVDFDFVVGADGVKVLNAKPFLEPKFLYYFVMAHRIPSLGYARHYRHIKDLEIRYPPLEEQQRIVAVLDEVFEGLTRARANAEANLQNARDLFDSFLGEIARHHAKTYGTATVEVLASEVTDGDHMPPPKAEVGVPFITISNVDKDTRQIDFTDTFMVPEAYYQALKDKRQPRAGDVLYTVTGSFGIPILVEGTQQFCFQRHIALVRPKAGIDSEWLYYMLLSPFAFDQANDGATGTAQRTVSLKLLRSLLLPDTPSTLQPDIAANLRARWEANQSIVESYRAKLQSIDALRQSLLQKAFAGELTG